MTRVLVRPVKGSAFQADLLELREGVLGPEGRIRYQSIGGEAETWVLMAQTFPEQSPTASGLDESLSVE